jgi:hypothetical protein
MRRIMHNKASHALLPPRQDRLGSSFPELPMIFKLRDSSSQLVSSPRILKVTRPQSPILDNRQAQTCNFSRPSSIPAQRITFPPAGIQSTPAPRLALLHLRAEAKHGAMHGFAGRFDHHLIALATNQRCESGRCATAWGVMGVREAWCRRS